MSITYMHIFLSYSRKDTDAANALCEVLHGCGASVFVDQQSLGGGENFRARIAEEIERCDAFVLLFSRFAAESEWVTREVNYADQQNRQIIVIRLDHTPLPRTLFYLNQHEYINLTYFQTEKAIHPETTNKLCRRTLKLEIGEISQGAILSNASMPSAINVSVGCFVPFLRFSFTTLGCFIGLFLIVRLRGLFLDTTIVNDSVFLTEEILTGFVGLLAIAFGMSIVLVWCVELALRATFPLTTVRSIGVLLLSLLPWSIAAYLIGLSNNVGFPLTTLAVISGAILTLAAVWGKQGRLPMWGRIILSSTSIWVAMASSSLFLAGGTLSSYRIVAYTVFAVLASITLWYPELLPSLRAHFRR